MSRIKSAMEDVTDFIESGYTTEQIIQITGYDREFIEKLKEVVDNGFKD